jgi:hypothetical protein
MATQASSHDRDSTTVGETFGPTAAQAPTANQSPEKVVGRTLWGALFGVGLAAMGCGNSFSEDCAASRSCLPTDEGEAGEGGSVVSAAGSGGGGGTGVDAETGGGAAGQAGDCQAGDAPPSVVSITPAEGSKDVERDATITVRFSEALDPDSVSADTLKLFEGDSVVAGTLTLSAARDQATFASDAPLALWTTYHLELSREIKDAAGVPMLDDESTSFQVRDGVWSVTTLDDADAIELPSSLPVSSGGELLTTWLAGNGTGCGAKGAWIFEGETEAGDVFEAKRGTGCTHVSASIAPDGSAIASWGRDNAIWTQSFANGAWAASERQGPGYAGVSFVNTQVFAHDQGQLSIVLDVNAKGAPIRQFLGGPALGDWTPDNQYYIGQLGSRAQAAFGTDGAGLATWTYPDGVYVLSYDAQAASWGADATILPGTEAGGANRGVPSVAVSPEGDAVILWMEGPTNNQVLKSSRFTSMAGWSGMPVNVSTGLGAEPSFDAPGVVFDGETFVSAWTAATGGKLTTYTARYDMDSGKWSSRESHVTDLGESAVLMPRLGVDTHRNLMLVWAVGTEQLTLVYQRYRADAQTWGEVQAIPDGTFTDPAFATEGKLAFGFAGNGVGGLMLRTERSGSQRLQLASFF